MRKTKLFFIFPIVFLLVSLPLFQSSVWSEEEEELEPLPTVYIIGSTFEEGVIVVEEVSPEASALKLYKNDLENDDELIHEVELTDVVETYTFTGNQDEERLYVGTYYVTQVIDEVESDPSNSVNITDVLPPVISIDGDEIFHTTEEVNVLDGITAEDNVDGNVTNDITVKRIRLNGQIICSSNSDNFCSQVISFPGEYRVTYTVSDEAGNVANDVDRIFIIKPEPVEISIIGSRTISVSGYHPDAILNLYNRAGQLISSTTATSFTDIDDGADYYVTQTVNGQESAPSNSLTILTAVTITGSSVEEGTIKVDEITIEATELRLYKHVENHTFELINVVELNEFTGTTYTFKADANGEKLTLGTYAVTQFIGQIESRHSNLVEITDLTPPIISIKGERTVHAMAGVNVLEGVTAFDDVDGDVTDQITVKRKQLNGETICSDSSGNPCSDTITEPGEYRVTYTVTDLAGNVAADVNRTYIITPQKVKISASSPAPGVISVEDYLQGATLKLYRSNGQFIESTTAPPFRNVGAGATYYVTQTVNGQESSASNSVTISLYDEAPTIFTQLQAFNFQGVTVLNSIINQQTRTVHVTIPSYYSRGNLVGQWTVQYGQKLIQGTMLAQNYSEVVEISIPIEGTNQFLNYKIVVDTGRSPSISVPQIPNTFQDWSSPKAVSPLKVWTITFNQPVGEDVDNLIFVREKDGWRTVPVILDVSADRKTIRVRPLHPYEPGQQYTLWVNNELRSKAENSRLNTAVKKDFSIQDHSVEVQPEVPYGITASEHGKLTIVENNIIGITERPTVRQFLNGLSLSQDTKVSIVQDGSVVSSFSTLSGAMEVKVESTKDAKLDANMYGIHFESDGVYAQHSEVVDFEVDEPFKANEAFTFYVSLNDINNDPVTGLTKDNFDVVIHNYDDFYWELIDISEKDEPGLYAVTMSVDTVNEFHPYFYVGINEGSLDKASNKYVDFIMSWITSSNTTTTMIGVQNAYILSDGTIAGNTEDITTETTVEDFLAKIIKEHPDQEVEVFASGSNTAKENADELEVNDTLKVTSENGEFSRVYKITVKVAD